MRPYVMVDGAGPGAIPVLAVRDLAVRYGDAPALRGVSLVVEEAGSLAVLGPNGAGKTTLLRAITGLLAFHGGRVTAGRVEVRGVRVVGGTGAAPDPAAVVRHGVGQTLEGRRVFAELSVADNLAAGAYTRRDRVAVRADEARVLELFPALALRWSTAAGLLSGGEQQMLAIARALMSAPRLLVLDEPSLGLAPMVVDQIGAALAETNAAGTALVMVEQQATLALATCRDACLMDRGEVVLAAPSATLASDARVGELYLGRASATVGEAPFPR